MVIKMNKTPNIILASKSARRREILEHLGLKLTVRVSNADESVPGSPSPERYAEEVSLRKAEAVKPMCKSGDLIIASDTAVYCNGRILGKPHSEKEAHEMLSGLSGTTHTVTSGIAVIYNGKTALAHETTEVTFRKISETEISEYVKTGEPFDKAGGYGIQDRAAVFTERINGDYLNVVGLPVYRLFSLLKSDFGLDFFDLIR